MKRLILFVLLIPVLVWGADLPVKNSGNGGPQSSPVIHFNNWTSTGQGTPYRTTDGTIFYKHRWIIDVGGTIPDNLDVKLKGKDNYGNWFTLDTYSTTTPSAVRTRWVHNKGAGEFRVDIDTFTNGSTITINSVHGGD